MGSWWHLLPIVRNGFSLYLYLCTAFRRQTIPPIGGFMNIPIIKQVPPESVKGKILFAGTDGKFYNAAGKELKPIFNPGMQNHKGGSAYPVMRHFGCRLCHHLIWETFVGPRTKGMEIDHINGNKLDWSLDNLQEVTPAENRKRAKILRILRNVIGRDPLKMSRDELLHLFNKYEFKN